MAVQDDQNTLNSLASSLASLNASYVDPTTYYNNTMNSLGGNDALSRVNTLKTALTNNENLITGEPANVGQRTQNADVTQGQKDRLVAMELQPLQANETTLGNQSSEAQTNYNNILANALQQANLYQTGYQQKTGDLNQQISNEQAQLKSDQDAAAAAAAAAQPSNNSNNNNAAPAVNPSQEFLSYIANQFKSAGKNPSRQTQDAWANAWFAQNGVPVSGRNAYWNLFNTTYNRPSDPTKDWLYTK